MPRATLPIDFDAKLCARHCLNYRRRYNLSQFLMAAEMHTAPSTISHIEKEAAFLHPGAALRIMALNVDKPPSIGANIVKRVSVSLRARLPPGINAVDAAKKCRDYRDKYCLTQAALAREFGTHQSLISRIERGDAADFPLLASAICYRPIDEIPKRVPFKVKTRYIPPPPPPLPPTPWIGEGNPDDDVPFK